MTPTALTVTSQKASLDGAPGASHKTRTLPVGPTGDPAPGDWMDNENWTLTGTFTNDGLEGFTVPMLINTWALVTI